MLDLLLRGGTLVTHERVEQAAAIGIRDGVIADSTGPARHVLDLNGRAVLPGFVNAHTHVALSYARGRSEDAGSAPAYTSGVPQGFALERSDALAFARLGVLEATLFGSTTLVDAYFHPHEAAQSALEVGVRMRVGQFIHDVDFAGIPHGRFDHDPALGERTLAAALAVIERWEGAGDGRITTTLSPHAPDTCSQRLLERIGDEHARTASDVTTHLAQSKGELARVRERSGCTPTEALAAAGLLDDRLTAAHCVALEPPDIERCGAARITVAHVPKGNATAAMLAPTPALRAAGAQIALATDNMHGDMVEAMRWLIAVARIQLGRIDDEWQPERALASATGSAELRPGDPADLVVIDLRRPHLTPAGDPLGTLVHCAHGRDVEHVIVAGRLIVEDGRSTTVDEDAIRREASERAARLWD